MVLVFGKLRNGSGILQTKFKSSRREAISVRLHLPTTKFGGMCFVLRYRRMHPEVARNALLAMHGELSLELCAVIWHISPMALSRLVCAFGHQSLVAVLTRCSLPLPVYVLADEKHSRCLTAKVYLPTIVRGRVIWHLGYTKEASAAAFTQSYGVF
jgi:hypothetical protein